MIMSHPVRQFGGRPFDLHGKPRFPQYPFGRMTSPVCWKTRKPYSVDVREGGEAPFRGFP